MPELELNSSKIYKMPSPLFVENYDNKTLVISRESANWLLLNNSRQLEIFNFLADGNCVSELFQHFPPDAQKDIYHVLVELEAKKFEDMTVQHPQEHGIYVYLTNRCNQRCRHCYMYAGENTSNELATSEIVNLLKNFSTIGGRVVTFTGGEVTVRPDFLTIIEAAKKMDLTVCVLTNGVLWSRQFIQKAAKYIDEVQVSIDGFDAESYRAVRGSNAFGDVLVSVNRLVEAGIRVTVAVTPLLDTLLGNEKRYVDFAKDLLARYKGKEFFVKFNAELMDGRDITPTEEENDLYRAAMKSIKNQCSPFSEEEGFAIDHRNNTIFNNCGYGGLTIAANGDVYFCNLTAKCAKQGNIRIDSFEDIWKKSQKARALSDVNQLTPCKECALKYICGGGCRVKNFTSLSGTTIVDEMDTDLMFARDSICTSSYKMRLYQLMVAANSLFYL